MEEGEGSEREGKVKERARNGREREDKGGLGMGCK